MNFSSFARSLAALSQHPSVRQFNDALEAFAINLTPAERVVWAATSEEPWGPTGEQLRELLEMTRGNESAKDILCALDDRMARTGKNGWRRAAKCLIALEHLILHGSMFVAEFAKNYICTVRHLESYQSVDVKGKDQGARVRKRAERITQLLTDQEELLAAREDANRAAARTYEGFASGEAAQRQTYPGGSTATTFHAQANFDGTCDDDAAMGGHFANSEHTFRVPNNASLGRIVIPGMTESIPNKNCANTDAAKTQNADSDDILAFLNKPSEKPKVRPRNPSGGHDNPSFEPDTLIDMEPEIKADLIRQESLEEINLFSEFVGAPSSSAAKNGADFSLLDFNAAPSGEIFVQEKICDPSNIEMLLSHKIGDIPATVSTPALAETTCVQNSANSLLDFDCFDCLPPHKPESLDLTQLHGFGQSTQQNIL